MTFKTLQKTGLFAALLLGFRTAANAQTGIANYAFAVSSNAYTPITGGTTVFSGGYDNSVSAAIPLGGTFTYGGAAYTTCYISTNGFITFGAASGVAVYTPLSSNAASVLGAIAGFAQDAGGSTVTGATPLISYATAGSEFVVQYADHANYYGASTERLNFQIRLNLATNAINIVYGTWTNPGSASNGTTAQVGLRGNTITWADNVNNLQIADIPTGTTCDWSSAITGNSNASTMLFSSTNNAIKPASGLTYTWTPQASPAPVRSFTAVSNLTTTGATINWTAPAGATQYNVQYRVPGVSNCAFTNFSGNPVTINSATLTGLTPGMSYQVRVQSSDGTNNAIYSHIPDQTGTATGYTAAGTFNTTAQTYVSSTTSHPSVATVQVGASAQQILQLNVVVTGAASPLALSQLNFSTNGSTNAADIANATVYYTGTSSTFATTTQYGTAVANPNGTFSVTGSQVLTGGTANTTNYFFLVYDLSCTATPADVIDAELNSFVLDGTTQVPTVQAPPGNRAIAAPSATQADANSTTAIPGGTINSPFVSVNLSGSACLSTVTSLTFMVSGTSPATDISNARVFYSTTSTFATTTLFGTAIANPAAGTITFTGSQALAIGSGNYFFLAYDVNCGSTVGNTLNGTATSVVVSGTTITPTGTAPSANAVSATTNTTIASGDYSNPAIWSCGSVPSSSTTNVVIANAITVTTAGNIGGNLTINAGGTLTVSTGTLTLGTSSAGAANGNSNRVLTDNGTLSISGGTLNLNGSYVLNSTGTLNMSGGIWNIDPNDGTAAGSATGITFSVSSITTASQLNVTGGAINLLDPPYVTGTTRAIAYSTSGLDAAFGTGNTVTLGGGDDVNAANTSGFYVECNVSTGTLEIGNMVVAGGRFSAQRHASTYTSSIYITKARNLTVNAGAEFVVNSAPMIVTGNLVNNGVVTTTANTVASSLAMAGDGQYVSGVAVGPNSTAQSISGSGFFKYTTAALDPTAQTGNVVGALTVFHTATSPGLTMSMPLTVNGVLTLAGGPVITSATNFLALGNGIAVPGNPAVFTATAGTLNGGIATALTLLSSVGSSYAAPGNYMGGWVIGTFNRYMLAAVNAGQTGIFPIGSAATLHPARILFTTAPTTPGYLSGLWIDGTGTTAVSPTLNEPAVTPSTINTVLNAIWQITSDAALTGGTYSAVFNNRATSLTDFANSTLLKRANAASPWTNPGTHVATTGSNMSPVVSRTGLAGFSQFSIGFNVSAPLPVTLTTIAARAVGTTNVVDWKTGVENNTASFEVERAAAGQDFIRIGVVAATGHAADYSFADLTPAQGVNYYRLRMIDLSGAFTYSRTVTATQGMTTAVVMSAYPNPATDKLVVTVAGASGNATVSLKDINGRLVAMQSLTNGSTIINMTELSTGVYFVIYTDGADTRTIKVNKQ